MLKSFLHFSKPLFVLTLLVLSQFCLAETIRCVAFIKSKNRAMIGSSVSVTMDERTFNGAYLGMHSNQDAKPVMYFFNYASTKIIWAYEEEVEWINRDEEHSAVKTRPPTIVIHKQEGKTCFANALSNCIENLSDISVIQSSAKDWNKSQKELFLRMAVGMTGNHALVAELQDRYALNQLSRLNISGRYARSSYDLSTHIRSGKPALIGLNVKIIGVTEDLIAAWIFHQVIPGTTPNHFYEQYYPGASYSLHQVLVLGSFIGGSSGDTVCYFIIADSKTGEIQAWKESDVLKNLDGNQILVGAY